MMTNEECAESLQEQLENIEEYVQSLESGRCQVIRDGANMKYVEIQDARKRYSVVKGALAAIINYDMMTKKAKEQDND